MTDIVERLRATTEEMAHKASVSMMLWDRHSNACLEAIDEIKRLRAANTELQGIDATLSLALERAQRERDEARAALARLARGLLDLASAIYTKHFAAEAPEWKPLDDAYGLLTQIDNMTAGISSKLLALEAERASLPPPPEGKP